MPSIAWDLSQNDTMASHWQDMMMDTNITDIAAAEAAGYKVCIVPTIAQRDAYEVCMSICTNERACGGPNEDTQLCES
eukprot:COSAG06_NODE_19543_length_833_cov_6.720708_1_plen_77_part_10